MHAYQQTGESSLTTAYVNIALVLLIYSIHTALRHTYYTLLSSSWDRPQRVYGMLCLHCSSLHYNLVYIYNKIKYHNDLLVVEGLVLAVAKIVTVVVGDGLLVNT